MDTNRSALELKNSLNDSQNDIDQGFSIISKEQIIKIPSPHSYNYTKSNIFSRLFFLWPKTAIRISNKRALEIDDVGYISKEQSLKYNLDKIQKNMDKCKCSSYFFKKYPLLYTIFIANFKALIVLLFLDLLNIGIDYLKMFFYRQIIHIFSKRNYYPVRKKINFFSYNSIINYKFSITEATIFFIAIKVANSFILEHLDFNNMCLSRKITNEMTALITKKILKIKSLNNFQTKFEGEKINLVETDAERIGTFFFTGSKVITTPIKVIISMTLLFKLFKKGFLFVLGVLVIIMSIVCLLQIIYIKNLKKLMFCKDKRMKIVTFVFKMLKNLKLNGWDDEFISRIKTKRNEELSYLNKYFNLELANYFFNSNTNLILMIICFAFFLNSNKQMDIATLFTAFQLINSMTLPLLKIPMFLNRFFGNMISINRIQKFLESEEQELYSQKIENQYKTDTIIKFDNVTFGIKEESSEIKLKTRIKQNLYSENIILLKNISISIKKGEFVCIIGDSGSGKSCLINAFLNKYQIFSANSPILLNGNISYYSQLPWIMTDTIKNNILFYDEYSEEKYNYIISLCQLKTDFDLLPLGDKTFINSTSSNVSEGQKAKITLARCLYRDSDIYLFDDPLSLIDNKTGQKIFEEVFCNYLKNKTRIFVMNRTVNLSKFNKIILMEKGKVSFYGNYEEYKKKFVIEEEKDGTNKNHNSNNGNLKNKFSVKGKDKMKEKDWVGKDEFKETNKYLNDFLNMSSNQNVSWKIYHHFIKLQGGYIIFIILVILIIACRLIETYRRIFVPSLTKELKINEKNLEMNSINNKKLAIEYKNNFVYFVKISLIGIILNMLVEYIVKRVTLHSVKSIHEKIIYKFVKAPINLFHDLVPIGQILNYLTKDIELLQGIIVSINIFIKIIFSLISTTGLCYMYNKASLILSPIIFLSIILLSIYFLKAGRNLTRLERISYSPILTILSETIRGADIIKTANREKEVISKMYEKLDERYGIGLYDDGTKKWYSLRGALFSHLFFSSLLFYMVYNKKKYSATAIAIVLRCTEDFVNLLFNASIYYTQLETNLTGLERCETVLKFQTEIISPKNNSNTINKNWPMKGEIKFINYSTAYQPNSPIVLNNINLEILSGKKIGIVGKTGSGKSSLVLALARILEPIRGTITIDGKDLQNINLDFLRKKITIIPQEPFLIEGNLRDNLDPLNNYSDEELLNIINDFCLFPKADNKLNIEIKEGGQNLSTGEKQLICLARGIIKKNKIFIMDDAANFIDDDTINIFYYVMKKYLKSATVVMITHNIEMVKDCNIIYCIDNGQIVELGKYGDLFNEKNSIFHSLYLNDKIV